MAFTPFDDAETTRIENSLSDLTRAIERIHGVKSIEESWVEIYCNVKDINFENTGNKPFTDIRQNGLGIEVKTKSHGLHLIEPGYRVMHPSSTRAVGNPSGNVSDKERKEHFITGYQELIDDWTEELEEESEDGEADLRWGVLLYESDYSQFVYFELEVEGPGNPQSYTAIRNRYDNLAIYDEGQDPHDNDDKPYITVTDDHKIQPYYEIPDEEYLYWFDVEHEDTTLIEVSDDIYDRFMGETDGDSEEERLNNLLDRVERN